MDVRQEGSCSGFAVRDDLGGTEREAFAAVLRKHGVEVLRPRLLTDAENRAAGDRGYATVFARDPFFTIGEHVIEGSMLPGRVPRRRSRGCSRDGAESRCR